MLITSGSLRVKLIFSKTTATKVHIFVNEQQCAFILYSRVNDTTCKRLRQRS